VKIEISTPEGENLSDVVPFAESEITHRLGRFEASITRVELHLRDINGARGGVDHRCSVEVRLAGRDPIVVDATEVDGISAVRAAVGKAQRAVDRILAKAGR
jgi:hypothetical protein